MDEPHDVAVSAVLLSFSTLTAVQRKAFTDGLNDFTFVSPQQQKQIADRLIERCKNATEARVRMIAEAVAVYEAEKQAKKSMRKQKYPAVKEHRVSGAADVQPDQKKNDTDPRG